MSITLATGTTLAVASAYATVKNMTGISNAAEAVATLESGHGVAVGDYIKVKSGWDLLDGRIVRAKAVATNDVTLEGVDTSDTSRFPTGAGAGTVQEISTWTPIGQVKSLDVGGGEPEFVDITTLADRVKKQIPTTTSPQTVDVTVFDDPTLAHVAVCNKASETTAEIGFRISFANGGKQVGNYYCVVGTPTVQAGGALESKLSFTSVARPIRYAT